MLLDFLNHQKLRAPVGLTVLFALAGCAGLPDAGTPTSIQDASHYASANTFGNKQRQGAWPENDWWTAYQDPQLNQLMAQALQNAPDMAVAAARLRQAQANAGISASQLQPQAQAEASVTSQKQSYNYLFPAQLTPTGWNGYGNGDVSFNWDFDFWGRNHAALAAAQNDVLASGAEAQQARLTLATALVNSYIELARQYALRENKLQTIEVRKKWRELEQIRITHGLSTRKNVDDLKTREASAQADLALIDEQINLQRHQLAALMGLGPDQGATITPPQLHLSTQYALPPNVGIDLLGHRPDVVAARWQVESQLKRIDQTKAAFYPNISLSGYIGLQSFGLDKFTQSGSSIGSFGPAISLPLFTGGRLQSELKGSVARYDEAVANYDKTVARALQDVADALTSQQALQDRLQKTQAALKASQDGYQFVRNRYKVGLSSLREVLEAQDGVLALTDGLIDLQSRTYKTDVNLMHALGGGTQLTSHIQE